jgi:tetratricopeptide (TPR) repeat protein
MQGSDLYRAFLGVPDEAVDFERRIDTLMSSTPLWPIVLRLRVESECKCGLKDESKRAEIIATYQSTMTRVASMIQSKPQIVPYLAWGWVLHVPPGAKPVDTPPRARWFRTLYPTGTAFEARRLQNQPVVPDDFVAHADAIHELSPWDPIITLNWSSSVCYKKHGCTPQEESAHFTRIADYSLTAMRKVAQANADPVAGMERVCAVSAADCWTLGDWLVSRERFPEAAMAFQQHFDRELDRVSASNHVEWLVRYYEKTGRLKDARLVAQAAANVGSARGMEALAGLLDRQGDHQQAGRIYREILERYDDGADLLAFLLRRADATGVAPAAPEYRALVTRYFEQDLEHVSARSLKDSPPRGLYVQSTSYWNQRYFRKGDIIVAVDGIRVWKLVQSRIQYDRSFDAPLRYTVWRDGSYVDVEGPFRQHYYGVDAAEYPLPARLPAATSAH